MVLLKFSTLLIGCTANLLGMGAGHDLAEAAKGQIGVTLHYDGHYQKLSYPGGDVPLDRGVCTDVVIRAYRKLGIDLQALVHDDMMRAWAEYPNPWRLQSTDRNIDHRRVQNLATYFRRHGSALRVKIGPQEYLPGDIITWRLLSGLPHMGIVSNERSKAGIPLVIHNIGWGTMQEDRLFDYAITGHFRYLP